MPGSIELGVADGRNRAVTVEVLAHELVARLIGDSHDGRTADEEDVQVPRGHEHEYEVSRWLYELRADRDAGTSVAVSHTSASFPVFMAARSR